MTKASTHAWPPRYLTKNAVRRSRGVEVCTFIEQQCRATKDTIAAPAGRLLALRKWQTSLIMALFTERPDGTLRYRQGLIGMPRKNGKTALGAGIGLHGLYLGPNGGEVYSVAGDREQARICFGMARRMVELDTELSEVTKIYRDALEYLDNGSVYRVLSSDAPLKEGLSPTLVLFDEVHVQPTDDLWSVMNLGSGARREAMVLGITTAGARLQTDGNPTLCNRLYEYGIQVANGEIVDDRFFFAWWEPHAGMEADWRDPAVWQESNPGFDDIVAAEDFEASMPPKVPEHEFRTKRTNIWVDAAESNWLADHQGAWHRCLSPLDLVSGASVCVGVDVALKHDSTAVVIAGEVDGPIDDELEEGNKRIVVRSRVWEPRNGRIDHLVVMEHLREVCTKYDVKSIAYDPRFFEVPAQLLLDEGLPMIEVPQSIERMVPACGHLYDLIVAGTLAHNDDRQLNNHVMAAVRRDSERGWILSKGKSRRHIDGCIAMALAVHELTTPTKTREMFAAWG